MISSFIQGDFKEASAVHHELSALFNVLFITTNPAPVKAALNILGKDVGGVRLPLFKPSQKEVNDYLNLLQRNNPLGLVKALKRQGFTDFEIHKYLNKEGHSYNESMDIIRKLNE